ncbi:MAG: glycosyltransferase [Terrabacter sp.]
MTRPATHVVLLTRFNLPTAGKESLIRAQEGWLRERLALFERYTIPSVRAQTAPVSWLVYLDPESPAWLVDAMVRWQAEGLLHPVMRERVSPPDVAADLRTLAGVGAGDRVVTANLDNDDGLAGDFVARIAAADPGDPTPVAVYVSRGLIRRGDELYEVVDRFNAFCAVAEPGTSPVTCWAEWHNLMPQRMPVIEIGGGPGWLQVVHGRNVSNRVRGRRTGAGRHVDAFGGRLDGVVDPDPADLRRERWLHRPVREGREVARAALKRVVFATLGKERFDAAKSSVAAASQRLMR